MRKIKKYQYPCKPGSNRFFVDLSKVPLKEGTFIRIKCISGKKGVCYPYAYVCKNRWMKGKGRVKQKVVKYLGRVDLGNFNKNDVVFDYCKCCNTQYNLTIDHIIPFCKGGKNTIDNIQVLCRSCNIEKGSQTITHYDIVSKLG